MLRQRSTDGERGVRILIVDMKAYPITNKHDIPCRSHCKIVSLCPSLRLTLISTCNHDLGRTYVRVWCSALVACPAALSGWRYRKA